MTIIVSLALGFLVGWFGRSHYRPRRGEYLDPSMRRRLSKS